MSRVAVFDADGVVVKKGEVFSKRFSAKHGVPMDTILEFFHGEFQDCLVGAADLKEVLPRRLKEWGVQEDIEEVLGFWFGAEAKIDEEVVEEAAKLRGKGIACYIATNNEKHRVQYLDDVVGLSKLFDGILSSATLGSIKPSSEFFTQAQLAMGVENSTDIWFWDDDVENVEGAVAAGWHGRLFMSVEDVREVVSTWDN